MSGGLGDVPGEAAAFGRQYELGRYEKTVVDHGPEGTRRFGRGMFVSGLVLLPIVVLPGVFSSAAVGFSVGMGVFAALLAGAGVLGMRKNNANPLYLYADGFALATESGPRVVRWANVVSLNVSIIRLEDVYPHLESCTVADRLDHRVTVKGEVPAHPSDQVRVIARKAEEVLTQRIVPRLTRAFDTGDSVTFGPVSIDRHGIADGSGTFAWQDIRMIEIDARTLVTVTTHTSRKRHAIDLAGAPNAFFAYHVIERAAAKANVAVRYGNERELPQRLPTP